MSRTPSNPLFGIYFCFEIATHKTKHDQWPPQKKIPVLNIRFIVPPCGTRTATKGKLAPVMGTSECWRTCQNHKVAVGWNCGEWQLKGVKWQFICHPKNLNSFIRGGHPLRMKQQNKIDGCCKQLSATQFELANRAGAFSFASQVSVSLWTDLRQGMICWIVFWCLAPAMGFAISSVIQKAPATKPRWSTTQRTKRRTSLGAKVAHLFFWTGRLEKLLHLTPPCPLCI